MSTAAILLAAGSSRRLGRPKQEIVLQGTTLLERAIRTAQQAGLDPVVAVVPHDRWTSALERTGAVVLLNPEAREGMSTSVHRGVQWLQQHSGVSGAVLMTCDQPALRPEHLRALCADPARITGSAYSGRSGVPAYFPEQSFASLLQLQGDAGARRLLHGAAGIKNESLALDIDTEEDLRRAEQMFTAEPS